MFRVMSVLLVIVGLGALVFGGLQLMSPKDEPVIAAPPQVVEQTQPDAAPGSKDTKATGKKPRNGLDDDDTVQPASVEPDFMASLRSVPIAHETPRSAKFGRAFDVTVAIDATGDTTAADALPGRGKIVEGEAKVSTRVQAALSGGMFEIEAVTPMVQTVSPMTENVWRWRVTPNETGAHDLVIELFALNGDEALPIRTYRDKVEVKVSRVGQIVALANSVSPLAMVFGGIGSLLAGLFGAARFFKGR